jgi:hypothetical protein
VPVEEVVKGHSSPVIYTSVADLDSDEAIRALVEKLLEGAENGTVALSHNVDVGDPRGSQMAL